MSNTPIYDQLRAELLYSDLPTGDNHSPPDAVAAQPVAEPRQDQRGNESLGEKSLSTSQHHDTDHGEGHTATRYGLPSTPG